MALFGASALAPSPAAVRVCLRRGCSAGGAPFCKRSVRAHERYAALLSGDGYSSDRTERHGAVYSDAGRRVCLLDSATVMAAALALQARQSRVRALRILRC